MPYNQLRLERRLRICDKKLSSLFADEHISESLQNKITEIQEYYNLSYIKANKNSENTIINIVEDYELYVKELTKVKKGILSPAAVIERIQESTNSRKVDIVFFNLLKACELIFWAAASITLYAAIFTIALPTFHVQPILGVAVGISIGGFILGTAYNFIKCLAEFKSFERHNTEYTAEASLVSFFKPHRTEIEEDPDLIEEFGNETSQSY